MKLGTQYPRRIVSGAAEAHTVMQGSQRSWSYDDGEGAPVFQSDVGVTSSFTRWTNNRGQGTHKVAFRFGQSTIDFGGVTWNQAFNVGGNNAAYGAANSMWVAFSTAANGGTYCNQQFPFALPTGQGVDAFSGFCWDTSDKTVWVGGLVVGRSYCFQIVVADNRGPGVDNRQVNVVPIQGMGDTNTSGYQRFAFGTEVKYTVVSVRFIATADVVGFRPDVRNNDGSDAGPQINALNILENVLPEGKMFYIANDGSDDNDGMSPETPWASISRVHERAYNPGDCILFKRGHKWTGQRLTPSGNGAPGQPIVLGAYGQGAHPLIDASYINAGELRLMGAIHLESQSYWIIEGFEVTMWGASPDFRSGIAAKFTNLSQGHLVIRNCHIHDTYGGYTAGTEPPSRWMGGVAINANPSGATDILVENNTITDIFGTGILFWGVDASNGIVVDNWNNLSTDVVIRNNTVWGCSGDNILYIGCKDALVEHNHSGFSGLHGRFPSSIAGLWGTRSDGGIQQYNHSHDTMTWGNDGQGLGIDMWMRGTTTLRYNYTHDNQGGFTLNYTEGENNESTPPSLLCHHNISINEPNFASARTEYHFHDVYYCPTDTFIFEWGAGAITLRNNVFSIADISSAVNSATWVSNNLWWTLPAKPTIDTAGVRADPLYSAISNGLILRDEYVSYNSGGINTPMASGQVQPRAFGWAKGQSYNTFGWDSAYQVGNSRDLELRNISGWPACAHPQNFAFGCQGPLTVRVVMRNVSADVPDNWLGLIFSNTQITSLPFITHKEFGMLFRQSGGTQVFDSGNLIDESRTWTSFKGAREYHIVEFTFTDAAGSGSAFGNGGTRIRVCSDGLLLGDYTVDQMSALYFAFNHGGSEWRVRRLHVFSTLPDVAQYAEYVGMVPAAGSPVLNTATTGVAPVGATDFFRNALDGTPNRGAIEVTTLAGYVQTPTRIEIRGRYRIARPVSGSLDYNYDAIIRDQNNRVIAATPTWSAVGLPTGVTMANGIVTVASSANTGRFALKATYGGVTQTFPVEII